MGASAAIAIMASVAGAVVSSALAPKPKAMQMEAPPSPASAQPDQGAANQQRQRAAAAQGRGSTIQTGPQGLGGTPGENQQTKSLLGY